MHREGSNQPTHDQLTPGGGWSLAWADSNEQLFATDRTHVPKQLFPDCMSMHALHRTDYSHHQQPLHSKGCNAIGVSCVCMTPHAEHLFPNTCSVDPPCLTNVCSIQACQEVRIAVVWGSV